MPRLTIILMHIKITYSTTARRFPVAAITFQFWGFKKIHIPCNGDIRGTYFHSASVRASDKRSPVVEQELLNPIYPCGAAE